MLKIFTVVGARPQFIKAAALSSAISNLNKTVTQPIIKEEISWKTAVSRIEIIINDICEEYDKDGHPYYSETLRNHWRRVLKG